MFHGIGLKLEEIGSSEWSRVYLTLDNVHHTFITFNVYLMQAASDALIQHRCCAVVEH